MGEMSENDPFEGSSEMEPTKVHLKGSNVISTLDVPPRADAVKAHEAAIRKHLQAKRPDKDPPGT
jgi:hypothetical protein